MPWSMSNPPPPAKNWTEDQKRRCITAANQALKSGKSESRAIFACIAAAGKSTRRKQVDHEVDYEQESEKAGDRFEELVLLLFAGTITLEQFRGEMQTGIQDYLIALMLLALGKDNPTDKDLAWLDEQVDKQYEYLEGFITALVAGMTVERAIWRARLYGWNRPTFVFFSLPYDVATLMPVLPGEDCLGGDRCRCHLEVEEDAHTIYVYWVLDPAAESCEVCIAHAIESPYRFEKR